MILLYPRVRFHAVHEGVCSMLVTITGESGEIGSQTAQHESHQRQRYKYQLVKDTVIVQDKVLATYRLHCRWLQRHKRSGWPCPWAN